MKNLLISIFIASAIFIFIGLSEINSKENSLSFSIKKIDANNVNTTIINNGSLDRNISNTSAGFEWLKGSGKYAVYSSGLWLSCKVNDSIRVSTAFYNTQFTPGYFDYLTQTPMGKDDPLRKVYKVSPLLPNGDAEFDPWSAWPVNQGAEWIDINHNGVYEPPSDYPLMKGSQNLFCTFTDGYRDTAINSRKTLPLRAEIHLYAYAKETNSCNANAIYYEWKIINKNITQWTDMSSAIWSDVDIGSSINDKGGTDSSLNMVYGYNGTNTDPIYGTAPPAVGYIIKEASRHNSNKADFAARWSCGFDCPLDSLQEYRVLHGLRNTGNPWINPITNKNTMFPYSGDPVNSSGWLDSTQGDRYVIIGSLFGTVASLDTINFKTITFINRGTTNLLSVEKIKDCVNEVVSINQISQNIPDGYRLSQNYPNPFNPTTNLEFGISELGFVSLKVYDILGNEVMTLVNENMNAGSYEVKFDGSNLTSGVYFYKLNTASFSQTKRMLLLK